MDLNENEIVPRSKKRTAENVFVQSQVKRIALLKENLKSSQQSLKVAHKQIQKTEESSKRLSMSLCQNVTKHNES